MTFAGCMNPRHPAECADPALLLSENPGHGTAPAMPYSPTGSWSAELIYGESRRWPMR
ncbi:hypothetical protein [Nonomuraea insulae]|uniref:Uncharacterized protein n=1 Tax=Nonomuraea insulae TaxID=1616787 RepID=A0ABW1D9Y1_9ACTN